MENQIGLLAIALMAAAFTGCSGHKNATGSEQPEATANVDIKGQWGIESIVFSDSDYVRPEEEVPGSNQRINFTDSTYSILTNCNAITGTYSLRGDSITIHPGAMTEVACDNMATEDALCRILPDIAVVYMQNDSTVRLDCRNPSAYILLRKVLSDHKD